MESPEPEPDPDRPSDELGSEFTPVSFDVHGKRKENGVIVSTKDEIFTMMVSGDVGLQVGQYVQFQLDGGQYQAKVKSAADPDERNVAYVELQSLSGAMERYVSRQQGHLGGFLKNIDASKRGQFYARFGHSWPFENILRRVLEGGPCDVLIEDVPAMKKRREGFIDDLAPERGVHHRLHFRRTETGKYLGYTILAPSGLQRSGIEDVAPVDPEARKCGAPMQLLGHVRKTVMPCLEGPKNGGQMGVSEDGVQYFVLGAPHKVTYLGELLVGNTVAYQQSSMTEGTCGHVAVATASSFLARAFGARELDEADARQASHALFPTASETVVDLREDRMACALASSGVGVHSYCRTDGGGERWTGSRMLEPRTAIKRWRDLVNLLHIAVDSSLPAIAVLGDASGLRRERHAVVAVGHTAQPAGTDIRKIEHVFELDDAENLHANGIIEMQSKTASGKKRPNMWSTTQWVKDFLLHDELVGPFLRMPAWQKVSSPSPKHVAETSDLIYKWDRSGEHLHAVLVPLPPDVRVDPYTAWETIPEAIAKRAAGKEGGNPGIVDLLDRGELVLSLYLDHAQRFRVSLIRQLQHVREKLKKRARDLEQKTDDGEAAKEAETLRSQERACKLESTALARANLPSTVYVATLLSREDVQANGSIAGKMKGYLLFDATGSALSRGFLLLWRWGQVLGIPDSQGGHQSTKAPFPELQQVGAHAQGLLTGDEWWIKASHLGQPEEIGGE